MNEAEGLVRLIPQSTPPSDASEDSQNEKMQPTQPSDIAEECQRSEDSMKMAGMIKKARTMSGTLPPTLSGTGGEPKSLSWAVDLEWHGAEWRWLNTVAFWVAMSFILGSILFIVGAGFSVCGPFLEVRHFAAWKHRVLVDYAYLIGASYFLLGAYLGFFLVINVGKAHRRLWAPPHQGSSMDGYFASLLYFVGACSFGIACAITILAPSASSEVVAWLEWFPQAIGGLCFTIAAGIELHHNAGSTWRHRAFWVCVLYLLGSALFLVAASAGFYLHLTGTNTKTAVVWACDLPYLLGRHAEQFGLAFIREINATFHEHAQPIQPGQQLSLALYALNGALSAVNICFSAVWHLHSDPGDSIREEMLVEAEDIISDLTALAASHSMLLLATAVHFTPTLQPYGYLLWLMRAVAVLFFAGGTLRCSLYLQAATVSRVH